MNIYDKINSNIWKNKIHNIVKNNELIIIYKFIYNHNKHIWSVDIIDDFKIFCNKNNIKIGNNFNDIINNIDNFKKLLFTGNDEFFINNKLLSISHYIENPSGMIKIDPNKFTKNIYSRCCNINNDNKSFFSFPVGIYDRYKFDRETILCKRIRTPEPIKTIILNNYLTIDKNIINYIYFLQTFPYAEEQKHNNPLYLDVCNLCKKSNIITHTNNQDEHWYNLNNHLFCLCVSWNTLESPRLWESLYFGCIPIIIDYYEPNNFIENHYNDLPILHISNIKDLYSEEYIKNKYKSIISNRDNYNF